MEGGDNVDVSDSPNQVDEYHLYIDPEGRPAKSSLVIAVTQEDRLMH
jgi:hypothetical protein